MAEEMLIPLVKTVAAVAAVVVSTWLVQKFSRRRQLRQHIAALHFEVESNIEWAARIFDLLNYLRDEAWVALKNDGYIGYLQPQVRRMIARVYDRMHALNERVKVARELPTEDREQYITQSERQRREFITDSQKLFREIQETHMVRKGVKPLILKVRKGVKSLILKIKDSTP